MPGKQRAPTAIGILGGSRVVGEAVALLLQGLGYRARFIVAPTSGLWPLADSQLVVLMPDLCGAQRAALLTALGDMVAGPTIPILELTRGDAPTTDERRVHWPCRTEELAGRSTPC